MIRKCFKYSFFFVNLITVIVGLFVLVCGIFYAEQADGVTSPILKIENSYFGNVTAVDYILVGLLMVAVAIFSCYLTTTTKRKLILLAVLALVMLEMGTATCLMARRNKMARDAAVGLEKSMQKYSNDSIEARDPTTVEIDKIQMSLNCCGSHGPDDWTKTHPGIYGPEHLPLSCCGISQPRFALVTNSTDGASFYYTLMKGIITAGTFSGNTSPKKLTCTKDEAFKDPCSPLVKMTILDLVHLMNFQIILIVGFQLVMVGIAHWISSQNSDEYPSLEFH